MAAIDVMRRYLEAVQRGDWGTGFGFFADHIVLHVPGRSSLAGEHRGREAAERYLQAALARAHGARVEVELVDVLASEEWRSGSSRPTSTRSTSCWPTRHPAAEGQGRSAPGRRAKAPKRVSCVGRSGSVPSGRGRLGPPHQVQRDSTE